MAFPSPLDVPWDSIRDEFLSGKVPLSDLADKYSIKLDTLQKRARRHGWRQAAAKARKAAEYQLAHAAKAQVQTAIAALPTVTAQLAQEWQDRSRQLADKIREKVDITLEGDCPAEDLQKLAGALDRVDTVGRRSLGLDKDAQGQSMTVMVGVGVIRPDGSIGIQRGECVPGDYGQDPSALTLEAEVVAKSPV